MQRICYFYFLIDQPLPQLKGKGFYKNAIQYYPPFTSWLRKFANTMGAYLDTQDSWNEEIYQQLYNDPKFGLKNDWYESPVNWKTFNDFFAKYLKSPSVRPIDSPDDSGVVVFPADSVPQGVWAIDENSKILANSGLKAKFATYCNVEALLGNDSPYKDAFANGVLTHTFLNVNDYHRYHFAVDGIVKEKKDISQNLVLEVAWNPEEKKYVPIDSTGWQFSQTRGYVIVDTDNYGLVALIPIGMAHVSSVNFMDSVRIGNYYKKGEMLGNFLFGGSDFIMLFQAKAGFEITAPSKDRIIKKPGSDLVKKEKTYKHSLVGKKYGVMRGPAL